MFKRLRWCIWSSTAVNVFDRPREISMWTEIELFIMWKKQTYEFEKTTIYLVEELLGISYDSSSVESSRTLYAVLHGDSSLSVTSDDVDTDRRLVKGAM